LRKLSFSKAADTAFYFLGRDSRQSMHASPEKKTIAIALAHKEMRRPLMMTSHPKRMRRRCPNAINDKTAMDRIVNGFMSFAPALEKKHCRN